MSKNCCFSRACCSKPDKTNPRLVEILIVIYLPLRRIFRKNLKFITLLGHNFVANPPEVVNK